MQTQILQFAQVVILLRIMEIRRVQKRPFSSETAAGASTSTTNPASTDLRRMKSLDIFFLSAMR
jgi:hypothetical protein